MGLLENIMKTSLNSNAGCRINATFKVARVPGNFHVSTHSARTQPKNGDMKHTIHELTFGDTIEVRRFEMKENKRIDVYKL